MHTGKRGGVPLRLSTNTDERRLNELPTFGDALVDPRYPQLQSLWTLAHP
ncbi:MAG: hypothetical protein QOK28_1527 [Actinomycetota bacterium]